MGQKAGSKGTASGLRPSIFDSCTLVVRYFSDSCPINNRTSNAYLTMYYWAQIEPTVKVFRSKSEIKARDKHVRT